MANIGSLVASLELQTAAFFRDMRGATAALESNTAQMRKAMRQVEQASRGVERQIAGMRNAFTGLGAAVAAMGLGLAVRDIVKTTAEFQKLQASLKTVTGSAGAAQQSFAMIKNFAASTPFDLQQVTQGFIKLKALGLDPSERALRAYGNTASAMGKTLNDFIEAVADAATGEFERLKEFGIKASSEGDKVTFTFQGVATTIGKNAAEIEEYLRRIGEVQFAGAMEEQAKTLGGALSNLGDAFSVFQNEVGEGGLGSAVADLARQFADAAAGSQNLARQLGGELASAVRALGEATAFAVEHMREIGAAIAAFIAYRAGAVFLGIAAAVGQYVLKVREAAAVTGILNAVMSKNPIGLLATVIATGVAALVEFSGTKAEATTIARDHAAALASETGAVEDQTRALLEQRKTVLENAVALSEQRASAFAMVRDSGVQVDPGDTVTAPNGVQLGGLEIIRAQADIEAAIKSETDAANRFRTELAGVNAELAKQSTQAAAATEPADKLVKSFRTLQESLLPNVKALHDYEEGQKLLNDALKAGLVTQADYQTLLAKLGEEYDDAVNGTKKLAEEQEKAAKAYAKTVDGLKAENKLLSLKIGGQKDLVPYLEAEADLRERLGRELTPTESDEIHKLVQEHQDLTKTLDAQTDAYEKQKREAEQLAEQQQEMFQEPFKNAVRSIQNTFADTFENIFSGGVDSFKDLAGSVKSIFIRLAAEIAALMVFRPVVGSVLGAVGLGGIAQQMGVGSAGSSLLGANGSGFGGGAMNLLSLGKMIPGVTGAIDAFGASTGLFAAGAGSAAEAAILADAAAAGVAPAEALAGASTLSTTLSAALGAGGIGLTAGMLLGQLTGSRAIGGIGGAGTGALAGFAIGGPVGAVIGGIAGGLGGLIGGGGKEPHPASSTQIGVDSAGNLILGASAAKHADISQSRDPAAQIIKSLNTLFDQYGFLARGGSQVAFDVNASKAFSPEQAIQQLVMSATSGNAALDQAVDTFFGSRSGGMDANALLNAFSELASTFKTIESIDLDPKPLSQVEEALKRVNDGADQLRASAEKFGFSAAQVAKIEEARAKALADVTETFNTSISDQILAITNPQELAMRELERAQKDRLEEAKKAGADLVAVEKLAGLEREKVIEQFSQQSVDSLKKFMEELTFGATSGVAPVAQLSGSRAAFDAAAAQALAGDLDARDRIVDLGQTFLNASRSVNASTGAYFKDRDRVRDIVSALLGDVPGFASGGSFQVPALAGNDNMIPLIRVSGGETVSVTRNNEDARNTSIEAVRQQTTILEDALHEIRDAVRKLDREFRLLSQKVAA